MPLLEKEELLNLARLSALEFDANELDVLNTHVSTILSYVTQLQGATVARELEPRLAFNVLRDDVAQRSDRNLVLAQAPDVRDGFFVVPKILDEK